MARLCLIHGMAWLPFPWSDCKAQSLPKAPGALSELPSLSRLWPEQSQHSRVVALCHPRDTLVTFVFAFVSEEHEGVQGTEGGGDAVAFGNSMDV